MWQRLTLSCRVRNPCGTVVCVVTQAMGVKYQVKPVIELVTQITIDVMCSLSQFHFENLWCVLIIVRSGPMLKSNEFWTFGKIHAKLVVELYTTHI
jgi:hypothetical protein